MHTVNNIPTPLQGLCLHLVANCVNFRRQQLQVGKSQCQTNGANQVHCVISSKDKTSDCVPEGLQ